MKKFIQGLLLAAVCIAPMTALTAQEVPASKVEVVQSGFGVYGGWGHGGWGHGGWGWRGYRPFYGYGYGYGYRPWSYGYGYRPWGYGYSSCWSGNCGYSGWW